MSARPGLVALVGGGEHLPGCETIDRHLLEAVPAGRPVVALVPFASSLRTRARAVGQAVAWWDALGADVLVADRDPHWAGDVVAAADIIVLTGGVPDRLATRLARSPVLRVIVARHAAGAHIAGSSSGAMVLGSARQSVRPPFRVLPALGLVPGVAVAPHHGRSSVARAVSLRARTHPHLVVVGIDDRTALVGSGSRFVVRGVGSVTVMRGTWTRRHGPGESVRLPAAPGARRGATGRARLVALEGSAPAGRGT